MKALENIPSGFQFQMTLHLILNKIFAILRYLKQQSQQFHFLGGTCVIPFHSNPIHFRKFFQGLAWAQCSWTAILGKEVCKRREFE